MTGQQIQIDSIHEVHTAIRGFFEIHKVDMTFDMYNTCQPNKFNLILTVKGILNENRCYW